VVKEQRILIAQALDKLPEREVNEKFLALGPGWTIVSAITQTTVYAVQEYNGPMTHCKVNTTTIVAEKIYNTPLISLKFGTKTSNRLRDHHINSIEELTECTAEQLLGWPHFGESNLKEVRQKLAALNPPRFLRGEEKSE
jgi:DNA-directed RNA polymerase alpha subunit